MSTLTIEPADGADIPAIVALAQTIWPQAYAGILRDEHIENLLANIYTPANLAQEMGEGHRFWLARAQGAPVGFASAYREAGILWLKKLYVLPQLQGGGIGRALMHAAQAAFPGCREMRLYVNARNIPAQQFYRHTGFRLLEEAEVQMGDHHFIDYIFSRPLA